MKGINKKYVAIVLLLIMISMIIINNNFKLKPLNVNSNESDKIDERESEGFENGEKMTCNDSHKNTIMVSNGNYVNIPKNIDNINPYDIDYYSGSDDKLSDKQCKYACKSLPYCTHYSLVDKEQLNNVIEGNDNIVGKCKMYETCIPSINISNNVDETNCVLDKDEDCVKHRIEFPLVSSDEHLNMKCKKNGDIILNNIDSDLRCKNECKRKICRKDDSKCEGADEIDCELSVYDKKNKKCHLYSDESNCELIPDENHKLFCRKPNEQCSKLGRKYINTTLLPVPNQTGKRYTFNTKMQKVPITFK